MGEKKGLFVFYHPKTNIRDQKFSNDIVALQKCVEIDAITLLLKIRNFIYTQKTYKFRTPIEVIFHDKRKT